MFHSRRINNDTNKVEVWECEWSNKGTGMARKEHIRKAGDEDELVSLLTMTIQPRMQFAGRLIQL